MEVDEHRFLAPRRLCQVRDDERCKGRRNMHHDAGGNISPINTTRGEGGGDKGPDRDRATGGECRGVSVSSDVAHRAAIYEGRPLYQVFDKHYRGGK